MTPEVDGTGTTREGTKDSTTTLREAYGGLSSSTSAASKLLKPEDVPMTLNASPSSRRVRRAGRDRSSFIVDELLLSSKNPKEAFMASLQASSQTPTVTLNNSSKDINAVKPPLPKEKEEVPAEKVDQIEKLEKIEVVKPRLNGASSSKDGNLIVISNCHANPLTLYPEITFQNLNHQVVLVLVLRSLQRKTQRKKKNRKKLFHAVKSSRSFAVPPVKLHPIVVPWICLV